MQNGQHDLQQVIQQSTDDERAKRQGTSESTFRTEQPNASQEIAKNNVQ
jgi:hypothetical protein